MGSTISQEILVQLSFVKKKIICYDNDAAGIKLTKSLKSVFPDAITLSQNQTKDIDDLVKTGYKDEVLKALDKIIKTDIKLDVMLRF
ncbi:hypothetical protein D3C81_1933740 [compost metagenome]